jgi:CBS domain-containing protein
MNRELFSLRPDDTGIEAIAYLRGLGVHAAPVIEHDRLLGVVTLGDLAGWDGPVGLRATQPVVSVRDDAAIEEAARLMGEARLHHLVAVDAAGNAVGMLSSLDVVCALLGLPATHPPMFPHYDTSTGLTWTDDTPLAADRVEVAPDGVGILVLVTGGAGRRELPVWAEASRNVRTRLLDLLTTPQRDRPMLARLLEREHLRFRAASARSFSEAASLAERLRTEALGSLPTPRT